MARATARRDQLAEAAAEYVLEHGLLGLSLRPLASALGTSDRMLLYHFADKDDLVATALRVASDQSGQEVDRLPAAADVRRAVHELWDASTRGQLERCQRLYVEAAALGLLGKEPYATVVREANERWVRALASYLERAGCPGNRSRRAVMLLDAALAGFQLDLPLDRGTPELARAVADLAEAVASIAGGDPVREARTAPRP